MKIIQPEFITDSIFSLIDEAKEQLTFVSPYYNFYKWDTFLRRIENAKKRSIKMSFWAKESDHKESINSIEEVKSIGYNAKLIKQLNVRIYFNEQTAIVCSMNLVFNAKNDDINIAFQTENKEEYEQVMHFYARNIHVEGSNLLYNTDHFLDDLDTVLQNMFQKRVRLQYDGASIEINAKGRYKITIVKEKGYCLKMSNIITKEEYLFFKTQLRNLNQGKVIVSVEEDEERYHCLVWGSVYPIRTEKLDKILDTEVADLKQWIIDFVVLTQDTKAQIAN